jgi:HAD superfamily hydrolase (TIGR01509 family)
MKWLIDHFDALMFDLDGTLVDTMPLHYEAYAEVLRTRGLNLEWSDFSALVGPPAGEVIGLFVAAAGGNRNAFDAKQIHAEKKAAFERRLTRAELTLLPAANLLEAAAGKLPCALVSSGNRHGVDAIIAALGWGSRFAVTITGDDVTRGKPDPEPYRLAAKALGIAAGRCAALEDTEAGLASARAAGMIAFDVTLPTVVT